MKIIRPPVPSGDGLTGRVRSREGKHRWHGDHLRDFESIACFLADSIK